ncbi:MAG: hypothetical protein ACU0BB_12200 [Paracoccaceae bacterium]
MRAIVFAILTLLLFASVGAVFGLYNAKVDNFRYDNFGTVPAHRCVVEPRRYCGMFYDADGRPIEVSRMYRSASVKGMNGGTIIWEDDPFPHLTQDQLDAVMKSRSDNFWDAHINGGLHGAALDAAAWVYAFAAFVALLFVKPMLQIARKTGGKLKAAGKSAHSASMSFGETAALRAEVRKKELLARKAVAEATLTRDQPDVIRHDVELKAKFRA